MTQDRIPVILDTDIGSDIDDTWALAMLLKSPELDIQLITTDRGNTPARARIVAKFLNRAGRADIPIGVGINYKGDPLHHDQWANDYPLSRYPGTIHDDGVKSLCDTIMNAESPITLICIGPMPNIGEALKRCPGIAKKAHFAGMHGSINMGHGDKDGAIPECNVVTDAKACRAVFEAPWLSKTITPLDTCGSVRLTGDRYQAIHTSKDPVLVDLMANYRIWAEKQNRWDWNTESSILFDTVAIALAFCRDYLEMRRMKLVVTEDGYTREDPAGSEIDVAIAWENKDAYLDFLKNRLLSPVVEK